MEATDLGAITTAAAGSAFGLIGSAVSRVAGHVRQRQFDELRVRQWKYELYRIKLGAPTTPPVPTVELYNTSKIEGIRTLFRPALTALLLAMCFFMYVKLGEIAQNVELMPLSSSSPAIIHLDKIYGLIHYIVHAIVFSTTTAIVWWFGDRGTNLTGANLK